MTEIKLLDLSEHPRQRELFTPLEGDTWREFCADINHRGIMQPVIVSERTGEYVIADGHQRVRAARLLGWQTVPAIILPFQNELAEVQCLIMNNTQRRQLSREEVRRVVGYWLMAATPHSNKRIADEIGGISKNTVEQRRTELEAVGLIDQLDTLEGKDGKLYPRKKAKPQTAPPAFTEPLIILPPADPALFIVVDRIPSEPASSQTRRTLERVSNDLFSLEVDEVQTELEYDPGGTFRPLLLSTLRRFTEMLAEDAPNKTITVRADQA